MLLPRSVRRDAYGLYAFCRLSDDAVDAAGARADAVPRLRARLSAAYAGRPADAAADRALAEIVTRHAIPQALPAALLEGLAWDAAGRRHPDLSSLVAYAARVGRLGRCDDDAANGASAPPEPWPGPATSASPCNSPTSPATSARMPATGASTCPNPGCARPARSRRVPGRSRARARRWPPSSPACSPPADLLYARAESGIAMLPPSCRPRCARPD